MASAAPARPEAIARVAFWDATFVGLSLLHAVVLCTAASIPIVALGLWWNANTISHNFIHRPFFRARGVNAIYSAFLTVLLGVPQRLWRARHLAHHAETGAEHAGGRAHRPAPRLRWTAGLVTETALVVLLFVTLAWFAPGLLLSVYAPGYLIGLALCQLQGHFEHERRTTSHYGGFYNALFFNDGYHVEHHERPGAHWTSLPGYARPGARESRWPAVLRWLDWFTLASLERLVLRSPRLQQFVLGRHEEALRVLLPQIADARRVTIVGGGLFPRTALLLEQLLPGAELTVVDVDADHLETARGFLGDRVVYRHERYDPATADDADLAVIPLAFAGDRQRLYTHPPARAVLVHDWVFARHSPGAVVSWLLLKRLNLVRRDLSSPSGASRTCPAS